MSQNIDSPFKTFTAGEALEAERRVKLSAAKTVSYADAGEAAIGVTRDAVASGALVAVKLIAGGVGTFKVTAAGTFAVNATLYGAADGKVDDAVSGGAQFKALEAATADGGKVEALAMSDVEITEIPDASVTHAKLAAWKTGNVAVAADALAIPVTHAHVSKTTGADAEALTLANGTAGQILVIDLVVDGGGSGTLTPTTMTGFATIVFADAGDQVALKYVDDTIGWIIVGATGVAAPPAITI